jgi:UDP-N-acetylglucosamine--N-acetylmuramyl-(pentapeptide) pyrophosphoryl-undecaprenol N-acetylglucosamine transferase
VYPALTTWQELENKMPGDLDILWIGGEGGMEEELVRREKIRFQAIPAAGVHGVGLRALPGNIRKLWKGYYQARSILQEFKPDVLFFTGGYLAVPVAFAGSGYRKVLYVPDIQPALALQTLAFFANQIALTVEDSKQFFLGFFKKKLNVTGYPIRSELKKWSRSDAQVELKLQPGLPTLLVTGGSKGSRSINQAVLSALPDLLPLMQIVHLTGRLDWDAIVDQRDALEKEPSVRTWLGRYHLFPFLHEMGAALASADLVVSRAGASILGEYPYFGLPAILVPYPYAWKYQKVNASWLVERGAAVLLPNDELPVKLSRMVKDILLDPNLLEKMQVSSRFLSRPDAAGNIAELVLREAMQRKRSLS